LRVAQVLPWYDSFASRFTAAALRPGSPGESRRTISLRSVAKARDASSCALPAKKSIARSAAHCWSSERSSLRRAGSACALRPARASFKAPANVAYCSLRSKRLRNAFSCAPSRACSSSRCASAPLSSMSRWIARRSAAVAALAGRR